MGFFKTTKLGAKTIFQDSKKNMKKPNYWENKGSDLKTWGYIIGGVGTALYHIAKYFAKGKK